MKPKVVVETGVDKGLGSIVLCAALLRNRSEGHDGQYYGTDLNPKAGYLLCGKYSEVGKVLYGDSLESLRAMKNTIDIFINDSDHSATYEAAEYEAIVPLLSEASIILGDNSHVTPALLNFSRLHQRKFLFWKEEPINHWYPGGGIGFSFKS
jgi:predicted O-methyltransferase YrrM